MRILLALAAGAWLLPAAGPEFEQALRYYHSADFDKCLEILLAMPEKDAAAWELLGRSYYLSGEPRKAAEALEKALAAEPDDSNHALWLGRAYGREAESASLFLAPGLAVKARQYFEKAVQLNPRNLDALSDLFEYYLDAPGLLGGGVEKAAATARQMAQLEPAEGQWAEAQMAEKRKEYHGAEEHLRRAAEDQPHAPGRWIDLARFLYRQGRYPEAEQIFAQAEKLAPGAPRLLYERAAAYLQAKRNLDTAEDLLRRYLTLPLTDEDPPRSDAAKLLRQAQGN